MKHFTSLILSLVAMTLLSASAQALTKKPTPMQFAEYAAAAMINGDVRTIIREVENTDDNPCMPKGKSFQVDLEVKKAFFNREKLEMEYEWQVVKTIGVDGQDGSIIEVCAE